jgi:peroxiredoxin
MKLPWIGLFGGLALACGGLLLLTAAKRPHVETTDIEFSEPRHPVTPEMTRKADAETRALAPGFTVKDVLGKEVTLASPSADRPQFVYFVMDGCPCSFDAEPLFHDLSKQFKDQVDFVSVTDAKADKAKRWYTQMLVPYPVIADPDLELIKAYKATNSVFSVLLDKSGHIEKMWPGYSVDILKEMNSLMAKLAGVPEKPFDTKYAPIKKSSGCAFPL